MCPAKPLSVHRNPLCDFEDSHHRRCSCLRVHGAPSRAMDGRPLQLPSIVHVHTATPTSLSSDLSSQPLTSVSLQLEWSSASASPFPEAASIAHNSLGEPATTQTTLHPSSSPSLLFFPIIAQRRRPFICRPMLNRPSISSEWVNLTRSKRVPPAPHARARFHHN